MIALHSKSRTCHLQVKSVIPKSDITPDSLDLKSPQLRSHSLPRAFLLHCHRELSAVPWRYCVLVLT